MFPAHSRCFIVRFFFLLKKACFDSLRLHEEEWWQVAPVAEAFANAMLVQEGDRRTEGSGCRHNLLELTGFFIDAAVV
jgi:hypothetical protein